MYKLIYDLNKMLIGFNGYPQAQQLQLIHWHTDTHTRKHAKRMPSRKVNMTFRAIQIQSNSMSRVRVLWTWCDWSVGRFSFFANRIQLCSSILFFYFSISINCGRESTIFMPMGFFVCVCVYFTPFLFSNARLLCAWTFVFVKRLWP